MKEHQEPASKQEQNYDYIFEELDKKEKVQKLNKPHFLHDDGTVEPVTFLGLLKYWAPMFIFLGLFIVTIITYQINEQFALIPFGSLFMVMPLWVAFAGKGKFRPRPEHYLFLIVGLIFVVVAVSSIVHTINPFFDMELFKKRSVLGFGVGITVLSIALIAYDIIFAKIYRAQVQATFVEAEYRAYAGNKPFGTVTWQYEWEGRSYTGKTYNTTYGDMQKGMTKILCINPSRPERIRINEKGISWGWGVFYLIIGITVTLFSLLNYFEFIASIIPIWFGIVFIGLSSVFSFEDKGKFRPFPSVFIFYIIGIHFLYAGATMMYFDAHPQSEETQILVNSVFFIVVGACIVILGFLMIVSDIFRMKTCRTEVYATCKEIKPRGLLGQHTYGTITWQYNWLGYPYTSKTYNTFVDDFCVEREGKVFIDAAQPERIRIKEQSRVLLWGILYMFAGLAVLNFCTYLSQRFVLLT